MKSLILAFKEQYKHQDYLRQKKAEYTAIIYMVLSVYALVSCGLFWSEALTRQVGLGISLSILIAGYALVRGHLMLTQNLMFFMILALAYSQYEAMSLFHFYGEMVILLFVLVIIYIERYQFVAMITLLSLGLYNRYMMTQSYLFILDHNRLQASQHVFIMTTLAMLIFLSFYVDRMIHKGIEEKRLLQQSVHVDLLTDLYTRMKFNEDVGLLISAENYTELGILDIDKFKLINDTYGHHTGDLILKELAMEMKAHFPEPHHRLYRWGGEEFIVISKDRSPDDFDRLLDDFRQHIDDHLRVNELNVTVSIGTTTIDSLAFRRTFCRADNALYKAKNTGRNLLVRGGHSDECDNSEIAQSI